MFSESLTQYKILMQCLTFYESLTEVLDLLTPINKNKEKIICYNPGQNIWH